MKKDAVPPKKHPPRRDAPRTLLGIYDRTFLKNSLRLSISIPHENVRKPEVFRRLQGV